MIKDLARYLVEDEEKRSTINNILFPPDLMVQYEDHCLYELDYCEAKSIRLTKYCPRCHRKYGEDENFCYDCLIALKNLDDIASVRDIEAEPMFTHDGSNDFASFDELLCDENISRIDEFRFLTKDYNQVIKDIKIMALKNFDGIVKSNEIVPEYLTVLDKVLLFSKAFTRISFKSYGQELGMYSFNQIEIDDRQTAALQITTLMHELSHFLIKEILTHIICKILDCTKSSLVESLATFILSYSPFTRLIDEYSAHSVEGRFTVYGYQDYSSFIQIEETLEGEMSRDEIEITKSIGNCFSNSIKDILEAYIDYDLRSDIKEQFLKDVIDKPNYEMLALENCDKLKNRGFMKAIWLILIEGMTAARDNIPKLEEYNNCFIH